MLFMQKYEKRINAFYIARTKWGKKGKLEGMINERRLAPFQIKRVCD